MFLVDVVVHARAVHPFAGGELGSGMGDFHLAVVELPVAEVFEEVGLAVDILEGGVHIVSNAAPNAHVTGIV